MKTHVLLHSEHKMISQSLLNFTAPLALIRFVALRKSLTMIMT